METTSKKRIKITFNAPVVLIFVGICLVATLLNYITNGKSNITLFMTYHSSLANPLTYVRFVTHIFGHANWTHFMGNMSFILLLGPLLEEKYGARELIEAIIFTGAVTGIFNYIFFPNIALCGASGVVFAFILLSSFTSFKQGEIPLTFIIVAVIYIGQEIYKGVALEDNISNLSHVLGGVVGSTVGYYTNKKS
ncbi:MAG: rhomboid family intramembrane serine protease [Lachnospiraceae bacterium]|nr:rhomboid family intramembrane serine protease [Lachnospiraceae bacterium]